VYTVYTVYTLDMLSTSTDPFDVARASCWDCRVKLFVQRKTLLRLEMK